MLIGLYGAGLWPTVPLEDVAASCHLMESEGLVRNIHTSSLWLYPDTSPAGGLLPFYSHVHLSSCNRWSPGILLMFLRLCWVTQQTFLDAYKWYAVTEKQDHLCKVTGLQFPPQATSSDEEEEEEKSNCLWLPHAQPFSSGGLSCFCLCFAHVMLHQVSVQLMLSSSVSIWTLWPKT